MGIIIAELLREFAARPGDERILVKSGGRLLDFCLTAAGAALVKACALDYSRLLPLDLMSAHRDESVRNVVNKGLPHFRRRLDLALEKVPAEQANKILGDIEAMQVELEELEKARPVREVKQPSRRS